MEKLDTKRMKTISGKELRKRLDAARTVPGLAHLPAFGLMAPHGWDYHDQELIKKAQTILIKEGIDGVVKETAPALFWYKTKDNDIHCHVWRD